MFYYYDPTWIILLPAIILALVAQAATQSAFRKYSQQASAGRWTGAQLARAIMEQNGIHDIPITEVRGQLTDHYDPKNRRLGLSKDVYDSFSVAALSIAAHEVGHAMQHNERYAPLAIRNSILPVVNISTFAAFPLLILGLFLYNEPLVWVGIAAYSLAVFFQLATLPVEFNASARALAALEGGGYLTREELPGAKKVLRAAAMTYVAAAITSILQLLRLILISGVGRRRN